MTSFPGKEHSIALQLVVLSALALFLELLVIRWLSAEIRLFAIFKTFPLVAYFVGLGVGFAAGKDRLNLLPWALLVFVALVKLGEVLHFGVFAFPSAVSYQWQSAFESYAWYFLIVMVALVLFLIGPFMCAYALGSRLGILFEKINSLSAYSLNVAGSIAGSLLFALGSFALLAPWQLVLLPVLLSMYYCWSTFKARPLLCVVAIATAVAAWVPAEGARATTYWSPYQRLDLKPSTIRGTNIDTWLLTTNHWPYQVSVGVEPSREELAKLPAEMRALAERWSFPFLLKQNAEALIVACGMGSDVAYAVKLGAKSVDAVDIDPVIIKLGKERNPLKPYQSENVQVYCDDARHFFKECTRKYDLVVFSHLDSHTVSGMSSSVRVDNYVYTKESFERALSLLKPDGLMVVTFCTRKDWLVDRLFATLSAAAGYAPLVAKNAGTDDVSPNTYFVLGTPVKNGQVTLPDELLNSGVRVVAQPPSSQPILTDDWPFLYLASTKADPLYLVIAAEILLLALWCSRKVLFKRTTATNWQLFFMGAAFILMELQFIARLSLLFGATWMTSAIVINGVLCMILLANAVVYRFKPVVAKMQCLLFVLLMGSILASYAVPASIVNTAQAGNVNLVYALVTLTTFLPVWFSAMIFPVALDRAPNTSTAFAYNMLGAVLGAMLEYLSNHIGINNLLLVAVALYGIAFAFYAKSRSEPANIVKSEVVVRDDAERVQADAGD